MVWCSQLSGPGLGPSLGVQGIRVHDEVERCSQRVKCLEIGDWLEVGWEALGRSCDDFVKRKLRLRLVVRCDR